ncbi:hypothetical protein RB653_008504 [Dictyostelium firmibasis]|uniref:Uncharacterized protein n=1 Tax=Dictyostelium firmibasis TaxID=79012 RepID=A0AAN7U068_9MYCE
MIHSKNLVKLAKSSLNLNNKLSQQTQKLSILNFYRGFCSVSNGKDKDEIENGDSNPLELDTIFKVIEKDIKDKEASKSEGTKEATTETEKTTTSTTTSTTDKPKKGRPKGSKNKVKSNIIPEPPKSTTTPTPITKPKPTATLEIPDLSDIKSGVVIIPMQNKSFGKHNSFDENFDKFLKDNPSLYNNILKSVENIKNGGNMDKVFNQLISQMNKYNKTSDHSKPTIKYRLTEDIIAEDNLLPRDIVNGLDEYVIGQAEAKRAISIALRNRWRRKRLDSSMKPDVYPKNILMIGPTGVGKTELARRLAKIVNAPFVKVEATKYTEVGYHGPDVDTIIRDLIEASINNIKTKIADSNKASIEADVEKNIISSLIGLQNDLSAVTIEELLKKYRDGQLDDIEIEIEVLSSSSSSSSSSPSSSSSSDETFFRLLTEKPSGKIKKVTVSEARDIFERMYRDSYAVSQDVTKLAIQSAEQNGIVFLDEIDKICSPRDSSKSGGDASTDGVQRDLLPIIEGCMVSTKYGQIDTSRILFIASGAFHSSKPSDLISELQGRLPIRVELKPLEQKDFYKILTEPKNNQIQQQKALLKTEGIQLEFTDDALLEVAKVAFEANSQVQNLGARRLHGIIERIVEDLSFNCDLHKGKTVVLDAADVRKHLSELLFKTDLSKYII